MYGRASLRGVQKELALHDASTGQRSRVANSQANESHQQNKSSHPVEQQEMPFLPHFLKALDKTATESVGEEECRATIGAAGDELQFTGTVDALLERHGAGSILATIAEGKNEGRGIWVNADTKGVSAPAGGQRRSVRGPFH